MSTLSVTVLQNHARETTHDIDAVFVKPTVARIARELVANVADELNLPEDWLNDNAKGYLHGLSNTVVLFQSQGIIVHRPLTAQLLAMKLAAWRSLVDEADSRLLLSAYIAEQMIANKEAKPTCDEVWNVIHPYVVPGRELKARLALESLFEEENGNA